MATPSYEEQKSYYDAKWLNWVGGKRDGDEICRLEFIVSGLRKLKAKSKSRLKIIDLGCGRGWITHKLSKYGDVVGIDLSTSTAQRSYPDLEFIQANIMTDDIPGRYDIVVSSEVVEHLFSDDQHLYIKKAHDLLNEKGYIILTTPNRPRVESMCKELQIDRKELQPIENWLDRDSLYSLLDTYFETVQTGSTVFHPILIRKHKYLNYLYLFGYVYLRLYKLINRLLSSSQQGLYLTVIGQKRAPHHSLAAYKLLQTG